MKHTQLPWHIENLIGLNDVPEVCIVNKKKIWIASTGEADNKQAKDDAEFIITACNNYYNFIELLRTAENLLADALDREECHNEDTGEMYDDWQALSNAIDKCKRR